MDKYSSEVNKEVAEEQEKWRKSLPAQVFLNHFFALQLHIKNDPHAYDLGNIALFQQFRKALPDKEKERVKKHLLNSWNTEYTLRATAQLGGEPYLRHALHWTFPQANYSIQESLKAMLILHGTDTRQPYRVAIESGKLVVKGAYPQAVSFYATGHAHRPHLYRLPYGKYQPGLKLTESDKEAQQQIGQFLRTTHRQRALQIRAQVQRNPLTALRSQKSGKILERFDEQHWQQISWRIGYTTIFDLLSRLKISANHREIERFVEADIDMTLFHESLLSIVEYLNFVHEAYVAKAVGLAEFQQWIQELPDYLRQDFISDRVDTLVSVIKDMNKKTALASGLQA